MAEKPFPRVCLQRPFRLPLVLLLQETNLQTGTWGVAQHAAAAIAPQNRTIAMKTILKSTLSAAMLASAAILLPTIATAGVDVSVGIGVPGAVYAPGPGYSPYEGGMYYDPIYFGGSWYHGPYRWRMEHGQRVFWLNGGWHANEWQGGPIPGSLTFRNGGDYRGGRYEGFGGAETINARFPADRGAMRPDHPVMNSDRGAMHPEHPVMNSDRGDMSQDKAAGARDDQGRDSPDGPHN